MFVWLFWLAVVRFVLILRPNFKLVVIVNPTAVGGPVQQFDPFDSNNPSGNDGIRNFYGPSSYFFAYSFATARPRLQFAAQISRTEGPEPLKSRRTKFWQVPRRTNGSGVENRNEKQHSKHQQVRQPWFDHEHVLEP